MLLPLLGSGLLAGILAGFLGIGGGTVLVPILVALGHDPIQAVATSGLSIVITSLSGSIQNWRMGLLKLDRVVLLGLPALVTAQAGVWVANGLPDRQLLLAFGGLLLLNFYLVEFRKRVVSRAKATKTAKTGQRSAQTTAIEANGPTLADTEEKPPAAEPAAEPTLDSPNALPAASPDRLPDALSDELINPETPGLHLNPTLARLFTGGTAGFLAGVFGIGGGVIMVPLQIVLLGEGIKAAIQTSLGVIVMTAIAATAGHGGLWPWLGNQMGLAAIVGQDPWPVTSNVLWGPGFYLGLGGLVGAQISTRFLPKLDDKTVSFCFRGLLAALAVYIFTQALRL
ncbi:MAG: sulfite exporter TauE/SafE family protein [Prochlorothrix sp.]